MTSHEVMTRAIGFKNPPRLPVIFHRFGVSDMEGIKVPATTYTPRDGYDFDEWGCGWEKSKSVKNMGMVKIHPLAGTNDFGKMIRPNWDEDWHWEKAEQAISEAEARGKYVTGSLHQLLFEKMQNQVGLERVMMDLALDKPRMEELADMIMEPQYRYVDNLERRFGRRVHAIGMTDDWGTQTSLMISKDMWYDIFFPRYRKFFARMHAAGYHVWFHSCGKINDILGGLIEAGIDTINLQQVNTLGIEEIGARYRGKVTFWTLADIQATLPKNDPVLVDRDVAGIMQHWATPAGGVVFTAFGDDEAIGVTDNEILRHMYRRFSEWSEKIYGAPLPEMQK